MTTPGNRGLYRFSKSIDMEKLERENRRLLFFGYLFALVFTVFLGIAVPYHISMEETFQEPEERRRIVTDLIELPPRAVNPYETWTGPEQMIRGWKPFTRGVPVIPGGVLNFKSPPGFEESAYHFWSDQFGVNADSLIEAFIRGSPIRFGMKIEDPDPPGPSPYPEFKSGRNPLEYPHRISLRDEMLRIEDLDIGRYKGLVVLNFSNGRKIKGFVSIPAAMSGENLVAPAATARSVAGLVDALRKFTGISGRTDSRLTFSSAELAKYPFVYIASDDLFDLSQNERRNFGNYLRSGGFAVLESYGGDNTGWSPKGAGPLRQMLRDALGAAGELRPIPADHFFYSCFFEFGDGPPRKDNVKTEASSGQPPWILEGVWIGERLTAVYSEKQYGLEWSDPNASEAFLKIGVNMVIYALTQAGGLSLRLVDEGEW